MKFLCLPILFTFLVFQSSCARKATDEIDSGSFNGNSYSNAFFGMTLDLPPDWYIPAKEVFENAIDVGGEMMSGDDKNMKQAIKASTEHNLVTLFLASEHPPGSPVESNPNINAIAERVKHAPGIQKGTDYLFHTKKALEASAMKVTFKGGFTTTTMAGKDFGVMELDMAIGGQLMHQRHFATVMNGFAIQFVITYVTEEEEQELMHILDTLDFE